jgi:hypothetical protein
VNGVPEFADVVPLISTMFVLLPEFADDAH